MIYGSETSSVVQSRGIYHFPLKTPILCEDNEQCSSLGNSTTSWGAKSMESCILAERDTVFSMGQFIWTGFDYIGEPTPYHTRNSYFGQIDTAGFPKDSFYCYHSNP
jgi:beta-galactosidase